MHLIAHLNLWNPTHVAFGAALLMAFLLGIIHGVTPDEHTWPITFSYAVGGYSSRRGLRAGLTFSLAFTLQRALASELAYLGLSRILIWRDADSAVYLLVGAAMWIAGRMVISRSSSQLAASPGALTDLRPWAPALHGFIAGWGFGAFALIIYSVLAPAMPSAALGWVPGALFGLGTTLVQGLGGALFGWWSSRIGLSPQLIRHVSLRTAAMTLLWGGGAFFAGGVIGLLFPRAADWSVSTGVKVHNLSEIGLPLILGAGTVLGVGMTTLIRQTRYWSRESAKRRSLSALTDARGPQ